MSLDGLCCPSCLSWDFYVLTDSIWCSDCGALIQGESKNGIGRIDMPELTKVFTTDEKDQAGLRPPQLGPGDGRRRKRTQDEIKKMQDGRARVKQERLLAEAKAVGTVEIVNTIREDVSLKDRMTELATEIDRSLPKPRMPRIVYSKQEFPLAPLELKSGPEQDLIEFFRLGRELKEHAESISRLKPRFMELRSRLNGFSSEVLGSLALMAKDEPIR